MANICDTRLKITKPLVNDELDEKEFTNEELELVKEMLSDSDKYPDTACTYEDIYSFDNAGYALEFSLGTRWNVPIEALQNLAKTIKCDIRAIGEEDGMGFIQVVKIASDGELISDEAMDL